MTSYPMTKRLMIESQASNGKCYVRLLTLLPFYKKCTVECLEIAIVYMVKTLEKCPEGARVLPELFITNKILSGDKTFHETATISALNEFNSVEFMEGIFGSTTRFAWEEINGVQHIGSFLESEKFDKEVYNDMGFSARFVVCMLVANGSKIGSEAGLGDLFARLQASASNDIMFDDGDEDDETEKIQINAKNDDSGFYSESENYRSQLNDQYSEIEKLQAKVESLKMKLQESSREQSDPELDKRAIKRFSDLIKRQLIIQNATSSETDLRPTDSSSNVGRYENKYLKDGTIFDYHGDGKTQLTITNPHMNPLRPEKQVVVGYQKTPKMVVRENSLYQRVNAINGLANPFHSHRLNLLCHFDTAIRSVQLRKENQTYFDTIVWISKHKSQSPSQELLYQIIKNTFDLENHLVVANPYKLPFLEIGMVLNDASLAKCFDLLRLEFKSLWFEKMKNIMVPDFHNEFGKYKETKLSQSSDQNDSKSKSVAKKESVNKPSKGKRYGSILSFN